jgi:hypothetical protein
MVAVQTNKAVSDDLDWQCAICLNEIALPELATIKGCEHVYCGAHSLLRLDEK